MNNKKGIAKKYALILRLQTFYLILGVNVAEKVKAKHVQLDT